MMMVGIKSILRDVLLAVSLVAPKRLLPFLRQLWSARHHQQKERSGKRAVITLVASPRPEDDTGNGKAALCGLRVLIRGVIKGGVGEIFKWEVKNDPGE
jgi:hypothetical protein